ncbi:MAG: hypothetical protein JSR60_17760 [Proteobacteria bacterium]|nr:hypothetical protein [Pseudomonadota bacterium]
MHRQLMVSAAALIVMWAAAQAGTPGTTPTPADRAATERTSEESLANARANASADDAARRDFEAKQAEVDRERAAVAADRAAYARERIAYDHAMAPFRGPHPWASFDGRTRFRLLADVPTGQLQGLRVVGRDGDQIGRIQAVDPYGRVTLHIRTGETLWVDAEDLRYDPAMRKVYSDLTRHQIVAMRFGQR